MANVRRSARLSRTGVARRSSTGARNNPSKKPRLDSVVERDETPELAPSSIASVLATPGNRSNATDHLAQLAELKTPQTEPQPNRGEMHPKTVHQSTAKAPDSGLKLGFADISTSANLAATPSKSSTDVDTSSQPRQSMASAMPRHHQFNFQPTSELSSQAQKLMETIKADAEAIKAQMMAEREPNGSNEGVARGISRKIATAKGKAGRFSDVHMEQFKKMDSIENHPSSFRARPEFSALQNQSLKRKPSKANLDENERPRTAGKTATPRRAHPSSNAKSSIQKIPSVRNDGDTRLGSLKRARCSDDDTTSPKRTNLELKRPVSTLYSPTKAYLARTDTSLPSPAKQIALHRSNSVKALKPATTIRSVPRPSTSHGLSANPSTLLESPSKLPRSQSLHFKPLPALPHPIKPALPHSHSVNALVSPPKTGFTSKLPTFSNLKSILRSGRKDRKITEPPRAQPRQQTVSRVLSSPKKVDFTPSVKSRYAVKLAADSPMPAKARKGTPYKSNGPFGVPYDASAYVLSDDDTEAASDEIEEVMYPELPPEPVSPGPVVHTFAAKAKEHCRRESKEFKSIFTDLHANQNFASPTLTSINTTMNKTNPDKHATRVLKHADVPGATTIRQVRDSGVSELVQPFQNEIATVPHEIPGKKRRHDSIAEENEKKRKTGVHENHRISTLPNIPGAWTDTILEDQENQDMADNESENRGGKRMRMSSVPVPEKAMGKRQSTAREMAAKNAKNRKGKGILSFSRLNVLSRPKNRA